MEKNSKEKEIEVSGDMTIYEAGEIRELFNNAIANNDSINVNLSNVSEIDSSGIQLMVALKKKAASEDKTVSFISHSSAVVGLLDLFDLTSLFGDPIVMEK